MPNLNFICYLYYVATEQHRKMLSLQSQYNLNLIFIILQCKQKAFINQS